MTQPSLSELALSASMTDEPTVVARVRAMPGGVDPLGLRQVNFDMMDEVLPGLNNVARHIRPFVVLTWSWGRAIQLAQIRGNPTVAASELQDFVDRIDVIFVLSQILRDGNVDLPGRQYLAPMLAHSEFTFGGETWQRLRRERGSSTSLSAAINYGPGLKSLGWLIPHERYRGVLVPSHTVLPALEAFESAIASALKHPAFSSMDSVTVTRDEIATWAGLWTLDGFTGPEATVMREVLCGAGAPPGRRLGISLMLEASATNLDPVLTRAAMSGAPSSFEPPAELQSVRDTWRRVQVRQLFRLSLESLLYWTMLCVSDRVRSTDALVEAFLQQVPSELPAAVWLTSLRSADAGPIELMTRIQNACKEGQRADLPLSIAAGLACCLAESPGQSTRPQLVERLPLARARAEFEARADAPVSDFVRHVIESWVLAQHAYWSVGRGLADARAGSQRTLLRLKVALDEGGWTPTRGARLGGAPRPTADRLETAMTLARECGLLKVESTASQA